MFLKYIPYPISHTRYTGKQCYNCSCLGYTCLLFWVGPCSIYQHLQIDRTIISDKNSKTSGTCGLLPLVVSLSQHSEDMESTQCCWCYLHLGALWFVDNRLVRAQNSCRRTIGMDCFHLWVHVYSKKKFPYI